MSFFDRLNEKKFRSHVDNFKRMRNSLETFLNLDIQEIRKLIHHIKNMICTRSQNKLVMYFNQKIENFMYRLLHEVENYNDGVQGELSKLSDYLMATSGSKKPNHEIYKCDFNLDMKIAKFNNRVVLKLEIYNCLKLILNI